MSESFPKNLSDFYRYAIFVVYAVVIAQSFPLVTEIFIPYSKLFTFEGFENAFMLLLVYFFIISGWIGYFRSINFKKHSENIHGLIRFGLDLFIIYQFYYMFNLVPIIHNSDNSITNYHGDIFIWSFPIIFLTFLIWDIVKYFEFQKEYKIANEDRRNRLYVTFITLIIFTGLGLSYYFSYQYLMSLNFFMNLKDNIILTLFNLIFCILTSISIYYYRSKKWNIPKTRYTKTKIKKIKKTLK